MNILIYSALLGALCAGAFVFALRYIKTVDINDALEEQLDQLVLAFQQQIPMAGMFLKGKLLEKLRNQAKTEMIQSFPKMVTKVINKIKIKMILFGFLFGLLIGVITLLTKLLFIY